MLKHPIQFQHDFSRRIFQGRNRRIFCNRPMLVFIKTLSTVQVYGVKFLLYRDLQYTAVVMGVRLRSGTYSCHTVWKTGKPKTLTPTMLWLSLETSRDRRKFVTIGTYWLLSNFWSRTLCYGYMNIWCIVDKLATMQTVSQRMICNYLIVSSIKQQPMA